MQIETKSVSNLQTLSKHSFLLYFPYGLLMNVVSMIQTMFKAGITSVQQVRKFSTEARNII